MHAMLLPIINFIIKLSIKNKLDNKITVCLLTQVYCSQDDNQFNHSCIDQIKTCNKINERMIESRINEFSKRFSYNQLKQLSETSVKTKSYLKSYPKL